MPLPLFPSPLTLTLGDRFPLDGISVNTNDVNDPAMWQKSFGLQCLPGALLVISMALQPESPRWLLDHGKRPQAESALARLHRLPASHPKIQSLANEIQLEIDSRPKLNFGQSMREVFSDKRIFYRTIGIQFCLMLFQQGSGTNSINYYAPQIFGSLGIYGTNASLLATGVYGIVKVVTTADFLMFAIEQIGRKWALIIGGLGQSVSPNWLCEREADG